MEKLDQIITTLARVETKLDSVSNTVNQHDEVIDGLQKKVVVKCWSVFPCRWPVVETIGGVKYNRIILHCSATKEGEHITTATIRSWHTMPPRNWSDIGYHFVILNDGMGTVERGRPVWRNGAHTKGPVNCALTKRNSTASCPTPNNRSAVSPTVIGGGNG